MSAEFKWYVAHTYSGYENKVKDSIEKTVENRGLGDLIGDVCIPVEEVVEEVAEDNAPVMYSTDNPEAYQSFEGDEQ